MLFLCHGIYWRFPGGGQVSRLCRWLRVFGLCNSALQLFAQFLHRCRHVLLNRIDGIRDILKILRAHRIRQLVLQILGSLLNSRKPLPNPCANCGIFFVRII